MSWEKFEVQEPRFRYHSFPFQYHSLKVLGTYQKYQEGMEKVIACSVFPLGSFHTKLAIVFRIPPYWGQFFNDAVY